jgi:hypothetical protein
MKNRPDRRFRGRRRLVAICWLLAAAAGAGWADTHPQGHVPDDRSGKPMGRSAVDYWPTDVDYWPTHIVVRRSAADGGRIRYSYRVINDGPAPIIAISLGDEPGPAGYQELTVWPEGATPATVPPDSYTSPEGWQFEVIFEEGDTTVSLSWTRVDHTQEIFGGTSRDGFSVVVPRPDSLYEICHWEAMQSNGCQQWGFVRDSHVPSAPARSAEPDTEIIVAASPGGEVTGIRLRAESAGRATIAIYDARGRLVKRLVAEKLKAGWNDVAWAGDDIRGRRVASGTYFLRIRTAAGERTARLVIVR